MKADNRIINIIEDHALIRHTLDSIYCALTGDAPMPNTIPVLNDTVVTDQLSMIAEKLSEVCRKEVVS